MGKSKYTDMHTAQQHLDNFLITQDSLYKLELGTIKYKILGECFVWLFEKEYTQP
jgi:hypothetical protein